MKKAKMREPEKSFYLVVAIGLSVGPPGHVVELSQEQASHFKSGLIPYIGEISKKEEEAEGEAQETKETEETEETEET